MTTEPHEPRDHARLRELAERLVASGPKAGAVSASECHEISEGVVEIIEELALLRGGTEQCLRNTAQVLVADAPYVLENLRRTLRFLLDVPASNGAKDAAVPDEAEGDRLWVERAIPRDDRQAMIADWARRAFGEAEATGVPQRGLRLLEEAIEAYQACGCDEAMAHQLVEFVFARPAGQVGQELGGVAVTVLALAAAAGLSAGRGGVPRAAARARPARRRVHRALAHAHLDHLLNPAAFLLALRSTIGCPHQVREGLRRFGSGVDGQELADGRFCWRCRARHAAHDRKDERRRASKESR